MRTNLLRGGFLACALAIGCSADVETTDDAVEVEAKVPKVEIGDGAPDIDPASDDDIDVDTPLPGDS